MKRNIIDIANTHKGFTLIELMITLVLGMLISAAVIQVFITTQRVDSIQRGGSEVLDKSLFGMQTMASKIRLANLGNDGEPMNAITPKGGIVLTEKDSGSVISGSGSGSGTTEDELINVLVNGGLPDGYLTRSEGMTTSGTNAWNGTLTNTDVGSDQLTIQYTNDISITDKSSGKITDRRLFNCEGSEVLKGETTIERYYVTKGNDANLNLSCDAGTILGKTLTGLGTGETVIMENIDQFNIRLGVSRNTVVSNQLVMEHADMTVKDYMDMGSSSLGDTPFITNVHIAILARSSTATANITKTNGAQTFTIFGTVQTLKTDNPANNNYMRRLYETNILLRNGRLMNITDLGSTSTKL